MVVAALSASAQLTAGALADAVLERAAAAGDLTDDVAILVARFSGVAGPERAASAGSASAVGAG